MRITAKHFVVVRCTLSWEPSTGNGDEENVYMATAKVRTHDREEHEPCEGKTPLKAFFGALKKALQKLFPSMEINSLASKNIALEYDEFRVGLDCPDHQGIICKQATSSDLNKAIVQAIVEIFDAAVSRSLARGLPQRMVCVRAEAHLPNLS